MGERPGSRRGGVPHGRPRPNAGGQHLVTGRRAVTELLRAGPERVRWLGCSRAFPDVESLAGDAGIVVHRVTPAELAERATGVPDRGVVALADPREPWPFDRLLDALLEPRPTRRILVALDGVTDPQNLGAILRCAEFFGAVGAFWAKDRSALITPTVVRASAGATERLPISIVSNLATTLSRCGQSGAWVLGTDGSASTSLSDACCRGQVPDPAVLVLGREGEGLRRLTRERCDLLVRIEGAGAIGSLNVAAAAAVSLSWLLDAAGNLPSD